VTYQIELKSQKTTKTQFHFANS